MPGRAGLRAVRESLSATDCQNCQEGTPMRVISCQLCGQSAEAANDEELIKIAREHVDQAHPDVKVSDDQLRQIVKQDAKDK
jgi:predicted small metal-binding protein